MDAVFFRLAADGALLLHLAFIVFALFGAAIAVWWRRVILIHIPAAVWGLFVEVTGRVCPLTYVENYFRVKAGDSGYTESFVEHYLLNLIYPSDLTRETSYALAGVFTMVNIAMYAWLFWRWRTRPQSNASTPP